MLPQYSTAAFWPTVNTCDTKLRATMAPICAASTCRFFLRSFERRTDARREARKPREEAA